MKFKRLAVNCFQKYLNFPIHPHRCPPFDGPDEEMSAIVGDNRVHAKKLKKKNI